MKKSNIVVVMNNGEKLKGDISGYETEGYTKDSALQEVAEGLSQSENRFVVFNDSSIVNLDLVSTIYIEDIELPEVLDMPLQIIPENHTRVMMPVVQEAVKVLN